MLLIFDADSSSPILWAVFLNSYFSGIFIDHPTGRGFSQMLWQEWEEKFYRFCEVLYMHSLLISLSISVLFRNCDEAVAKLKRWKMLSIWICCRHRRQTRWNLYDRTIPYLEISASSTLYDYHWSFIHVVLA